MTNGHVDIILRGAADLRPHHRRDPATTGRRRRSSRWRIACRWRARSSRDEPKVEVDTFDGLLVDFARQKGAQVIVRGLRAISDFEYEFQMALMNRRLVPELETVFMMPAESYTYISSRLIREVFALGGPITGLVPDVVESRMRECCGAGAGARRSRHGCEPVCPRHIGVADDGAERAGAGAARAGRVDRAPGDRRAAEPGAAGGDRHGRRGVGAPAASNTRRRAGCPPSRRRSFGTPSRTTAGRWRLATSSSRRAPSRRSSTRCSRSSTPATRWSSSRRTG